MTAKKKTLICAVIIIVLACSISFLFFAGGGGGGTGKEEPPLYNATVSRVIDGDTVELDTGEKVRLLGINTPERGQAGYDEANERLSELVGNRTVMLESDREKTGKYGRLLRWVWVGDDLVNVLMVEEGLANVYTVQSASSYYFPNSSYSRDIKYIEELNLAEARAKEEQLGIWNRSEFHQCIGILYFNWNAEGDDRKNLNDEWVSFRNTCLGPVDMTGWTVSDAGTHRYTFPDNFTIMGPGAAAVTLYTGSGADDDTGTKLYWGSGGAVWNNNGDTLYLRDAGERLVLDYTYTPSE